MKTINPNIAAVAESLGLQLRDRGVVYRVFECRQWADLTGFDGHSSPETLEEPCLVVIHLDCLDDTIRFRFPSAIRAMEWMKELDLYDVSIFKE